MWSDPPNVCQWHEGDYYTPGEPLPCRVCAEERAVYDDMMAERAYDMMREERA